VLTVRCSGSKIYKILKVVISGIPETGILKVVTESRNQNILKIAKGKKATGLKRITCIVPPSACDCIVKDPVKLGDDENEKKKV
jgi:hypothetical protein